MAEHNDLGQQGEEAAETYLKKKGYTIKARNWRYGKEEIDIVAENEKAIVFAEVKTRSSAYFESPEQAVSISKQRFLINAADAYLKRYSIDKEARFDIMAITVVKGAFSINHIEEAFYPGL
jgi:putative endonuclease